MTKDIPCMQRSGGASVSLGRRAAGLRRPRTRSPEHFQTILEHLPRWDFSRSTENYMVAGGPSTIT